MNALDRTKYSLFAGARIIYETVSMLFHQRGRYGWQLRAGLEVEREEEAVLKAEAMLRSRYSASAAELWAEGHLVARIQRPGDWI